MPRPDVSRPIFKASRPSAAVALIAALALVLLALPSAHGAGAPGAPVNFKAKGEYAKHAASFCGKRRLIRYFHARSTIEYRGYLRPASGKHFAVKVEIKRCSHRRFVTVERHDFTGKKSGKFKGIFHAPKISHSRHFRAFYYFARAIVNGRYSNKSYFAVTR